MCRARYKAGQTWSVLF